MTKRLHAIWAALVITAVYLCVWGAAASTVRIPGIGGGGSYSYVDATPGGTGNDANAGTAAAPWATVAHAKATLSAGAPLKIRRCDGTWSTPLPPQWSDGSGVTAILPQWSGTNCSDTTKNYDLANGVVCTLGGAGAVHVQAGMNYIEGGSGGYSDCGAGTWGPGTGDISAIYDFYLPVVTGSCCMSMIGGGYLSGGNTGWGLAIDQTTFQPFGQIRSGGSSSDGALGAVLSTNAWHVIGMSVTRNSATGVKVFEEGALSGATASTVPYNGVNLTSAQKTALGERFAGGSPGLANSVFWNATAIVYTGTALSDAAQAAWATWMVAERNLRIAETTFYSLAGENPYNTSVTPFRAISTDGIRFYKRSISYAAAATRGWGNPQVIRAQQANGTVVWLAANEAQTNGDITIGTSSDGITYTRVTSIGGAAGCGASCNLGGMGNFYCAVDSGPDTPCLWSNIRLLLFSDNGTVGHGVLNWVMTPTADTFITWSGPVQITGTALLTYDAFNPNVLVSGGNYYDWIKDENGTTSYRLCVNATAFIGPYNSACTDYSATFGTPAESMSAVKMADGSYNLYVLRSGYKYSPWTPGGAPGALVTTQFIGGLNPAFAGMFRVRPQDMPW